MKRAFLSSLVGLLCASTASGQARSSFDLEMQARLIGVLTETRLSARFDGVPAREALRSLSVALGTPIIGRYADDRFGHGIIPDTPITFGVTDSPARLTLDLIVEQCGLYEPCIWQLRKGYIEVGTKERLSFPGAAETDVYDVRDLMLEPPVFVSEIGGGGSADLSAIAFSDHPYACAALTRPTPLVPSPHGATARKMPEELIAEIAEGIVEMVEPGNWDYGQINEDDADSELKRPDRVSGPWQAADAVVTDKIARIRIWEDRLVIRAPDYIHRQINGYPPPISPDPLTDAELAERSARASANGARLVVHGPAVERGATQVSRQEQLMRRKLHDELVGTMVSVELDGVPAREAFDRLGKQVGVPLIGRYFDDPIGFGIDPDVPITIEATERPAFEVLEEMLGQCSPEGAPCAWQIRKGFVEFGTKARLSVPAARDTRTYYIADIIFDLPSHPLVRTRRELNALELVGEICETIEPGQWDYGQPPDDSDREHMLSLQWQWRGKPTVPPRRYVPSARLATIRYWRYVIIVTAPDYIHRQINGYPAPTPYGGG